MQTTKKWNTQVNKQQTKSKQSPCPSEIKGSEIKTNELQSPTLTQKAKYLWNCMCSGDYKRTSAITKLYENLYKAKNVDTLNITNKEIAAHLKLPPVKLHCSMLAEDALKSSIKDYKKKN